VESHWRNFWTKKLPLRLVFINDGVMIISAKPYNFSETQTDGVGSEIPILPMTPSLMIQWKLDCRSQKQKLNNKPITMLDSRHCNWDRLVLPLLLLTRQCTFHWSCERDRKKTKTFWFFRLRFRRTYDSADDSDFHWVIALTTPSMTPSIVKTSQPCFA